MGVKTTKIYLGDLNGKKVYAIGPYSADIKKIIMHQTKENVELKVEIERLKKTILAPEVFEEDYPPIADSTP